MNSIRETKRNDPESRMRGKNGKYRGKWKIRINTRDSGKI